MNFITPPSIANDIIDLMHLHPLGTIMGMTMLFACLLYKWG